MSEIELKIQALSEEKQETIKSLIKEHFRLQTMINNLEKEVSKKKIRFGNEKGSLFNIYEKQSKEENVKEFYKEFENKLSELQGIYIRAILEQRRIYNDLEIYIKKHTQENKIDFDKKKKWIGCCDICKHACLSDDEIESIQKEYYFKSCCSSCEISYLI